MTTEDSMSGADSHFEERRRRAEGWSDSYYEPVNPPNPHKIYREGTQGMYWTKGKGWRPKKWYKPWSWLD